MTAVLAVACGVVGLAVGSLLDVVIDRVPRREPVLPLPPSLGPVTPRRVVVTLATGGLFAATAVRFPDEWALPAFLVFAAVCVAIAAIDLEHFIVPNRIVRFALVTAVPLLAAAAVLDHDGHAFARALLGSLGAGMAMLVVHVVQPRGMGLGDVKLALVLGLHLGWLGADHVVLGLFLGFLLGAVIGLLLIALRLRSRKDHVPFAPFLVAGAQLAVLLGEPILRWYR